jgi:hypothetical protein
MNLISHSAMLQFTMAKEQRFCISGIRMTAAGLSHFVPGLICQFIVAVCKGIHVSLNSSSFLSPLIFLCSINMRSAMWQAME